MRILLTGGTGLIGRALCRAWVAQGHSVWVWSRRPAQVASLCSGATGIDRLELLASHAPVDAVVNLAGAPIADRPWTAARRRVLLESRVDLTRTLVAWMQTLPQPPKVLISGSAVGWYGDGQDSLLDEQSASQRSDFGADLCLAWEQEAQRAQGIGVRVVCLRTAPVLSAQGGMLARMVLPFKLCLGGRIGNGQQFMPWIHLADEVGLIDFLLQHHECHGVFNACAPQQVRNAEFTTALAKVLARPAVIPAPAWALKLALGEMSTLLLGGQRLQPRRALEAGYVFQFDHIDRALANVLAS